MGRLLLLLLVRTLYVRTHVVVILRLVPTCVGQPALPVRTILLELSNKTPYRRALQRPSKNHRFTTNTTTSTSSLLGLYTTTLRIDILVTRPRPSRRPDQATPSSTNLTTTTPHLTL